MQILLASIIGLLTLFPQSYPEKPEAHILDEAEVIENSTQKELEGFLRSYRDSTGNYIEVVTVESLDGLPIERYAVGLFREWGIGNQNLDRDGVLLLVAPNEQKARIEVGYDMEDDLTDLVSNRIMEETLVPAFQEGNFTDGIQAGTHRIAQELNPASLAEIQKRRTERMETVASVILDTFLFLGLMITLGLVFLFLRRWYQRWRERQRLARLREKAKDKLDELSKQAKKMEEDVKAYLEEKKEAFSLDKHRNFVEDLKSTLIHSESPPGLDHLKSEIEDAESLIADDPESALEKLESISFAPIADEVKRKADKRLREVKRARKAGSYYIVFVQFRLRQARGYIQKARDSGFQLDDIPAPLDEVPHYIQAAEEKLAQSTSEPLAAVDYLDKAERIIRSVRGRVADLVDLHHQNKREIKHFFAELNKVRTRYGEAEKGLRKRLKESLPPKRRESYLNALDEFKQKADGLFDTLAEARAANSMDTQNLTSARELIQAAKETLQSLENTLSSSERVLKRAAEARDAVPELQENVAELEEEADELMEDDDVDSRASELFDDAVTHRQRADEAMSTNPPDVLTAEDSLGKAKDSFREAIEQAEDDIEEAERQRDRSRHDSADTSAGLAAGAGMSSSGGSSSNSGFGDMGGGISGGGGATGGW
jgi:uncharacterized protein